MLLFSQVTDLLTSDQFVTEAASSMGSLLFPACCNPFLLKGNLSLGLKEEHVMLTFVSTLPTCTFFLPQS